MSEQDTLLLPNLGAEEGHDWRGLRQQESVRAAAYLWSTLFSTTTRVRLPDEEAAFADARVGDLWPAALGARPERAAYPWLEGGLRTLAWYRSPTIESALDSSNDPALSGPDARVVHEVHDKAFAVREARAADLTPASIASLIQVLDPAELRQPDSLLERLTRAIGEWPDWTQQRFTLKPRLGSSGRGRVGGVGPSDLAAEPVRGAFARLASRGGAVFEPWLERLADLSVCLSLPDPEHGDALPTLLGSLEMLATAGGVYRGHCGEIDSRGRVFSGHRDDESLRTAAAILAGRAHAAGYHGPCGVDGFVFREGAADAARDRLRPVVELNARPTMGLVALGVIRRALPAARAALELEPGMRAAFLLALLPGADPALPARIAADCDAPIAPIDLRGPRADDTIAPTLFFARDLESLRAAHRRHLDC